MLYGAFSGILWAVDTILLSAVLIFAILASFLHDFFSFIFVFCLNLIQKIKFKANKKQFAIVALASCSGGFGMIFYICCIYFSGASVAGIASALCPIFSLILVKIILRQKLSNLGYLGLLCAILGILGLIFFGIDISSAKNELKSAWGLVFGFLCAICWGLEVVIINFALKGELKEQNALLIRQGIGAMVGFCAFIFFAFILRFENALPNEILGALGLNSFLEIISIESSVIFTAIKEQIFALKLYLLPFAAVFGSVSYLFYYIAIANLGALKAVGLNISYCAWVVVFTWIIFGEFSMPLFTCAILVIFGTLLSNARSLNDLKFSQIKSKQKK